MAFAVRVEMAFVVVRVVMAFAVRVEMAFVVVRVENFFAAFARSFSFDFGFAYLEEYWETPSFDSAC
jgi:hypothetical protein